MSPVTKDNTKKLITKEMNTEKTHPLKNSS